MPGHPAPGAGVRSPCRKPRGRHRRLPAQGPPGTSVGVGSAHRL